MPNAPQPGSLQTRIRELFESLPPGTELDVTEITERLGEEYKRVASNIPHSVVRGVLERPSPGMFRLIENGTRSEHEFNVVDDNIEEDEMDEDENETEVEEVEVAQVLNWVASLDDERELYQDPESLVIYVASPIEISS